MLQEKTCPECGRAYTTNDPRQTYCSRPCFHTASGKQRDHKVTLECAQCGKPFKVRPAKANVARYCSRACQNASQRSTIALTCKVCGKTYERIASRQGPYCSYACMGADKLKRVSFTCAACGKTFERNAYRKDSAVYCSRSCKRFGWARIIRQIIIDKGPTAPEARVQAALDELGLAYEWQALLGPYVADFLLPDLHLVLEIDGIYWHSLPQVQIRDARRTQELQAFGMHVVRLGEAEIMSAKDVSPLVRHVLQQPLT